MPISRAETPFRWYVTCGMPAYATLAGVRFDRIFRETDAIVEAFTVGEPMARERFGPDVTYGGPGWAGISYGHVNCLGVPLRFPTGSEVAHQPIYDSLSEGVAALHIPVDWPNAGMMPFYLNLWRKLKKAFPDRRIPFGGFGWEGPITTAWELRGHDFFLDLYDAPELCRSFLRLLTESIVNYATFIRSLNGHPKMVERIGLYDDVASLIHPDQWPEMVLPYHEQYFRSQTSDRRHAHIENLVPDHVPHLDVLKLDSFDPSVVDKVTPRDLRDRCNVPFLWRLNAMQVRDFSCEQIRHFVFHSVADGASGLFSVISRTMTSDDAVRKIHTFIDAAKEAERLLAQGCPRDRLTERTR